MDSLRSRGGGTRRVAELEHIDVHGDIDRVGAPPGNVDRLPGHLLDAQLPALTAGIDGATVPLDPALVVAGVHEAVDAYLHQVVPGHAHPGRENPADRRAVR